MMKIEVLDNDEMVANMAAKIIAAEARKAINLRGRFIMAVSGGRTPWKMLRALSFEDVPWEKMYIFQVDERIAPAGSPERNLTHMIQSLSKVGPSLDGRIYAIPVEEKDVEAAIESYSKTIRKIAGNQAIFDMVHLGLGSDGHTASLIPGDPVLEIADKDVASTGIYQGRGRITLTYPIINRSRMILWLVTGSEKCAMLERLIRRDITIPAGRVVQEQAHLLADHAAAAMLK